MITVIVVQSVTVFNDFTNPLYYLPGKQNATCHVATTRNLGRFWGEAYVRWQPDRRFRS